MGIVIILAVIVITVSIVIIMSKYIRKDAEKNSAVEHKYSPQELEESIQEMLENDEMANVFMLKNYASLIEFASIPQNIVGLQHGVINYCENSINQRLLDLFNKIYNNAEYGLFVDFPDIKEAMLSIGNVFSKNLISFFSTSYIQKLDFFNEEPCDDLEKNCAQYKKMLDGEQISVKTKPELFYYFLHNNGAEQEILEGYNYFLTVYSSICENNEKTKTENVAILETFAKNEDVIAQENLEKQTLEVVEQFEEKPILQVEENIQQKLQVEENIEQKLQVEENIEQKPKKIMPKVISR